MEEDRSLIWLKSSFCGSNSCVEVARHAETYFVRDGKDPKGPVLPFNVSEWAAFVAGVRAGEFD
jgi:hypothetical protein